MARKKKGIPIHGWINLNKPVDVTSTQAVGKIRRALKAQKVGHGGTLDPLASGVLPIALGEATKTVNFIQDSLKTYEFEVTWGEQRTTDDAEGEIINQSDKRPAEVDITALLPGFEGDIEQLPPQFSAVKIDGERAYDIARDGDLAAVQPREVYIESLRLTAHEGERSTFECHCGKGTYIRAIARDLGQLLGCFGYVSALKRTQVGPMMLEDAISLDFFEQLIHNSAEEKPAEAPILPLQTVLDDIPVLAMKEEEAVRLKNGNPVSLLSRPDLERMSNAGIDWKADDGITVLATYQGKAIALLDVNGAKLQPVRVFNI
jgi:tRNA pseudouridine55 synthase